MDVSQSFDFLSLIFLLYFSYKFILVCSLKFITLYIISFLHVIDRNKKLNEHLSSEHCCYVEGKVDIEICKS